MKHNLNHQKGSAHVVVVIVLVLALLTALGWIFWQNFIHKEPVKKDTDLVVVEKKEQKPESASHDLVIKEWKVGGDYDTKVDTLRYKVHETNANIVVFSAVSLLDNELCGDGSSGRIQRYKPTDDVLAPSGQSVGKAQDFFTESSSQTWKKVGGYYYLYVPPQQYCTGSQTGDDGTKAATDLVREFVRSLATAAS